jgi:hypothetical protein
MGRKPHTFIEWPGGLKREIGKARKKAGFEVRNNLDIVGNFLIPVKNQGLDNI